MTNSNAQAPVKILITGGSGFLGQSIVEEFLETSCPLTFSLLSVYDLKPYQGRMDERIEFIQGDICNAAEIGKACRGIDIVIHAAAIVDWGTKKPKEVYEANFTGTQHVINACKDNKVPILVYTSSLDTVITGQPLLEVDESQPYPERHLNMYCESKCLAEKLVLAASGEELKTIVLRPSDIFGERDPYHVPPLIEMAKSGFYVRIGDGSAQNQHVYVRNMAWAHVLATKALLDKNEKVMGHAYFITDGPGANFFTFFDHILLSAGYKIWPHNLWLPKGFMYFLGVMAESFALMIRPIKYYVPKLSRFAVMYTTTSFTFTSAKAEKDFGFYPKYSEEEAMENTVNFFRPPTP